MVKYSKYLEYVKLSKLKLNPDNPRIIKDDKFKKLCQSLKSFPQMMELRPIVIDENNVIQGGNMRFKALSELGYKDIPDAWIKRGKDLTADQWREFVVKDNIGYGEFNWEQIEKEWSDLPLTDWGLDLPGFDVQPEAQEDGYEIPDEIKTDIVLGDLFEIGEHRLLCGDSTDSEQVARLMNGEKVNLLLTDPPYGINIVKTVGGGGATKFGTVGGGKWVKPNLYKPIINDDKEFDPTHLLKLDCEKIIFGANYFSSYLPHSACWIVWNKKPEGADRNNFADCELAWTSFDKPARIYDCIWQGLLKEGQEHNEKRIHPTQKPIKLFSELISDYSKENDCVMDLYAGGGTTMLSAHQLKRKALCVEMSTDYCQVIIDRMLKLDPTLTIKKNGEIYNPVNQLSNV